MRLQLLDFAALIELELDFSGEDVEFADRAKFRELVAKITFFLKRLIDSFSFGNAMKNGNVSEELLEQCRHGAQSLRGDASQHQLRTATF